MAYTADELVTQVQRAAMVPSASDEITSAVILSFADEESQSVVRPWRRRVTGSGHDIDWEDSALVADQAEYRIPWRAEGGALEDVTYVDSDDVEHGLTSVSREDRWRYVDGAGAHWQTERGFCVEGDHVVLLPTPTEASGSLRMRYYRRPNRLVLEAATFEITAVDAGGSTTSYTGVKPSTITLSTPVDVIQARPNFDLLGKSATPGGVGATTIILVNADVSGAIVGDYIALAGETPIVQLPVELHPILVALVTGRVLEAIGDREAYSIAYERAVVRMRAMEALFLPRVEGKPRKAVNHYSSLRGGRYR